MSKQYYIIYETNNLANGKTYIGMHETNNLDDGYLGSGTRLKRAIRYYGKEFFDRRVLHVFDNKEDMISKEIELVNEEFINRDDTYNLKLGGEGGNVGPNGEHYGGDKFKGAIAFWSTPEGKQKLSENSKKNWKNPDYRENQIEKLQGHRRWEGKSHSEETKAKMRESTKGKQSGENNSQFGKCWITNGIESKKIFKGDSIPNGWKLGRKIK